MTDRPGDDQGEEERPAAAELAGADHLEEQLGEGDTGVEEALQAWREGGHGPGEVDDGDEIRLVHLPQLEPGPATPRERRPRRLGNVVVDVSVELGRRNMTVREICELKEQSVIELNKLAGEAFEIRVNGRRFAWGEVVVLTDMMAVRITGMVNPVDPSDRRPPGD